MTGEECKFLHPAPRRKYMKNPEKSCRAQWKGYHPELCKCLKATRECCDDSCLRTHLKGTRRKQAPAVTQEPSKTRRTTNQQQAVIATQNLAYNRPPLLLTLRTQNTTATHFSPSPTHYHTYPQTQYLTTHQTTVPLYPNPPPLHNINYITSSSSTLLNPFICRKQLHSHAKHTILLFLTSTSHLNSQDAWVPEKDTNWHNCEWS